MPSLTDILGSTFISFLNTKTDNIGDVDMYATDFKQIGLNIQSAMGINNITPKDIAEELDISMQAVNDILCGNKATNMNELTRIADVLGISVGWLIGSQYESVKESDEYSKIPIVSSAIDEIHMLEELLKDDETQI